MTHFWIDDERNVQLTYEDLVDELTRRDERHPVVYDEDPFEVLIEILQSLLGNSDLTLLDSEFSEDTLSSLGYEPDIGSRTEPSPDLDIDDAEELVSRLEHTNDEWTLTLYTSGTTGTPDRVTQTLEGLTRSVKRDERFGDHVWAFAYNPTHFAGLQVFFQAVLNRNPMIYIFDETPGRIGDLLANHGVTHISATPTFYRLRLQRLSGTYESVARLTSGGEKFEPSLRESLREPFPNAKFRNVYAITEAGSLLESDGEAFQIPEDLAHQITTTEDDELIVHESLLGGSVSGETDGEWFHTGDVVEYVDDDTFRFVGRKSDFVNVGGYRVNPHEVEKYINSVDGVEAAVVKARTSSVTGNILVAEIQAAEGVGTEGAKSGVKDAIDHLEPWKQPRVIDVVDTLDRSRSGKRIRRAER